jgi:hypothetical protein
LSSTKSPVDPDGIAVVQQGRCGAEGSWLIDHAACGLSIRDRQ